MKLSHLKIIEQARAKRQLIRPQFTDAQITLRTACEEDLYTFARYAWPIIEGRPFIDGWHVQAITEHLEALYNLEITDLLINQPFRTGKSLLCSVIYPAWVWAKNPNLRFFCISYAQSLSIRDSIKCRRLISSDWYQSLWSHKVSLTEDVNHALKFENTKGGYRVSSSIGGTITGDGGDFIIGDDLNNVKFAESDVIRESTNDTWDNVLSSRYMLLAERRRLVVQQRCHPMDVSGHIISKDDPNWVHLCLPMEYETHRHCQTISLKSSRGEPWNDPRYEEGELLWEHGIDRESLERMKQFDFNNSSYVIAGQLQQRPSPKGGAILQKEWFKPWHEPEWPDFDFILQSWDTALTGKATSAHSSCTTWGVFTDRRKLPNIMLLSLFTGQIEYPELRKMVIRLAKNYMDTDIDDPLPPSQRRPVDQVLIEAKASGHILLSDLGNANLPVAGFNPTRHGDKIARCRIVSHLPENGRIWMPTLPPRFQKVCDDAGLFLEAATLFPNPLQGSNTNDIIDSMSQAFMYLKDAGWIYNLTDPPFVDHQQAGRSTRPYYAEGS